MPALKGRPMHSIDISEEAGVRQLHFGSDWVQGAMRIARPWSLELHYTRELMAALLLKPEEIWPRRALLVGLGAGSVPKFLYRHRPECRITVVEIDARMESVARHYFRLPDDRQRLSIVVDDGARFMAAGGDNYDLIVVDGFDADGRAGVLDTTPFYTACRARLADQGLIAINHLGRNRGYRASVERIAGAFDGRVLAFPSCDSGNAISFATVGDVLVCSLDDLRERAVALKAATGLDLLPTLTRVQMAHTLPGGRLAL